MFAVKGGGRRERFVPNQVWRVIDLGGGYLSVNTYCISFELVTRGFFTTRLDYFSIRLHVIVIIVIRRRRRSLYTFSSCSLL